MQTVRTRVWRTLERRSGDAFLLAGVLLLASPAHIVFEQYMSVPLPTWLVALVILPGLITTLVGLIGLYPLIADRAPRMAAIGGLFTTLAVTTLVVLLGWILGNGVLTTAWGVTIGPPPEIAFLSLAVTMTLAFVSFGTASLRVAVPSRLVGALLLSFALPWFVSLAATSVYGSAFPRWLTLAIYGPIPVVMLATGYTLRVKSMPTVRDDSTFESAPG
ncbi:MAG: hypothetical protein ABEH81_05875 [Halopenitus sp.]